MVLLLQFRRMLETELSVLKKKMYSFKYIQLLLPLKQKISGKIQFVENNKRFCINFSLHLYAITFDKLLNCFILSQTEKNMFQF